MADEARLPSPIAVERLPAVRDIARGEDWRIGEFTCRLGPEDRPFEERHGDATIAVVVEGTFRCRTAGGDALLYPGSLLLGDAGACFECGHDHRGGDRCVSFQFAPALFEEIAATVTGSSRFRFPGAMLPAMPRLALAGVEAEIVARAASPLAMDEIALRLAETVLATVAGTEPTPSRPSARDQRRIGNALRHIEAHADERLALADVADVACMSKYHFLRSFRRVVGVTPHRFLLGLRMRRAAVSLRTTAMPVAAIAFDTGFGDLSTFNGRFRRLFGATPTKFRNSSRLHGAVRP